MITHFLGADEVRAFARDLGNRLESLKSNYPTAWFALGKSGENFVEVLSEFIPTEFVDKVQVVRVSANRDTGDVKFRDSLDGIAGPALLIDSAVHSGKSMLAATKKIAGLNLPDVITYSLVLKRNSVLVPNYFGVVIDETDRCLFQLDSIPNNRLCERQPFGVLRRLDGGDTSLPFIETGEPSIDETTFSSLLYELEKGSHVYVCEHQNKIVGVLSFTEKSKSIFIDLVANSASYRKKGVGAAMMRWAETWARSKKLDAVELWAIKSRVPFYQDRDFQLTDRPPRSGPVRMLV